MLFLLLPLSCKKEDPEPKPAPAPSAVKVTGITLDRTSASLSEGETMTLSPTVQPSNATDKSVSWSSDNSSVASVSNGKVTAVAPGNATITVKTNDGGFTATCKVSVTQSNYPVTGITLDKSELSMTEGEVVTLTTTIKPDNASNKSVTWSSSSDAVATVSEDGTVTAVAPGNATITVKTNDGGFTAVCQVTVTARIYPVTGVSLDNSEVTLDKGNPVQLTATVYPDNATNKDLEWSTSNPSVATVENGLLTAVSGGEADITVTTSDGGFTAVCHVSVISHPESISLNVASLVLEVGKEYTLIATITPADAVNRNVSWTSSDPSIVTVSGTGVLKAVKSGKATITVTTEDGNLTANCSISVNGSGVERSLRHWKNEGEQDGTPA